MWQQQFEDVCRTLSVSGFINWDCDSKTETESEPDCSSDSSTQNHD